MIIRFLLSWMSLCFPLSSSASYILTNLQLLYSPQPYFSWSSSHRFIPVFFLQSLASVRRPETCQSSAPKSSESFIPEIFTNLQLHNLHKSSASRSSPVFSSSIVFRLQLLDFHYPSEYSLSYKQLEPKNLSLKYLLHFSEILSDPSSAQLPNKDLRFFSKDSSLSSFFIIFKT